MAQPDPGAVPRRPHHISSIAHLFLQDEGRPDVPLAPTPVREWAVASPGGSPVSAFASAGLALASPAGGTLVEDKQLRWSAGSFLGDEGVTRVQPLAPDTGRNHWTIPGDGAHAGSPGAGGNPDLRWNHVGCLGPDKLAQLEALTASRSLGHLPPGGIRGLAWCLLVREAGRLAPNYDLGRLVAMLRPREIQILLFPDAWSRAGLPGWLDSIHHDDASLLDPGLPARCAEFASLVSDGIPVSVQAVAGSDNLSSSFDLSGEAPSLWRRLAPRMAGSGPEC